MTRRLSLHAPEVPSTKLPESGELVGGGKYRVDRKLGRGGMGAVFAVTHEVTGRRFAIKWLLATGVEGARGVRRFVREAQIAGRIQHPHVVDVYDIHQEDAGIFLVMELLEGESLAARLAREGCLGSTEACRILHQCAAGVAAAHASGVVHRDLKPANIFLCRGALGALHPKVLDFGISQLMAADLLDTTEARAGTVIGTPYYMAPEQLRGEACDPRIDVYALGVTLYEMLSGKRPFHAVSYAELVLKIVHGEAEPVDVLVPELPSGLAAVVARAMHRDPELRYATVDAFMKALQPFEVEAAAAGRSSGARRRRPLIVPLVASGALLLAGAAAWSYTRPAVSAPPVAHAQPEPVHRAPQLTAAEPPRAALHVATAAPAQQPEPAAPIAVDSRDAEASAGAQPRAATPTQPRAAQSVRRRAQLRTAPAPAPAQTSPSGAVAPLENDAAAPRRPRLQLTGL
ncbi:MAG TPA: protein kinase [Polyangiales bacterium]|nr:protein kinase [Polyangiales bacterium]